MKKIERLIYTNERGETVEFSHASVFHTNDVQGIADVRNELYCINSMGQRGDTYLGNRLEAREIEIFGHIKETDKGRRLERRRELSHVLNPQFAATLTYEYGDFKRVIDCKIDNAPVFTREPIFQAYTIQLRCPNPCWRQPEQSRVDVASWEGGLEFPVELHDEWEIGYRQPLLFVNVYNAGDVDTGIKAEFRALGVIDSPQLLNVDTGEFIQFNIELRAGDLLTINTHYANKTATLRRAGETTNAIRYVDPDSTFLQLAVGDNLFRYSAGKNEDNLEVSIYHDNEYLGV